MVELRLENVAIESLTPDPANARKHDAKNLEAIVQSLSKFGQRKPIVVTAGNVVLAGNGTLEAAKLLGWTKIAVTRTPSDWTWEQARAYALADNRTAELADWDTNVLAEQLLELDANGFNISELGFEPADMGMFDIDDTLPPLLDDGDKKPFQQMTFTLHVEQAEIVSQAIAAAKLRENLNNTMNDNSNANALFAICQGYVDGQL